MAEETPRWLEYMPVDELAPDDRNPKRHDMATLRESLARFGYTTPIERDERTGLIVSGHGRRDLLLELAAFTDRPEGWPEDEAWPPEGVVIATDGRWTVPVVRGWSSKDDDDAAAYLVAANSITMAGGWDPSGLTSLLKDLDTRSTLSGTGYSHGDLEAMLASLEQRGRDGGGGGDHPEPIRPPANPVTVRGDVWLLGPHRVMCGDCRDADDVATLIGSDVVNLAFTSPPYADRREYDETSGFRPVPPEEYLEWFAPVAEHVAAHLAEDGSWFINIKPSAEGLDTSLYVMDLVVAHVRAWGWHFATEFCWERNGVPKHVQMRFKNQFEPVYQFARGRWKIRPENVRHWSENAIVPLGPDSDVIPARDWANHQGGGDGRDFRGFTSREQPRKRKSLTDAQTGWSTPEERQGQNWAPGELTGGGWAYPGNRLPTFTQTHEATGHAAAYPVGLPQWFVKAYTDLDDVVYDPFVGSGSTMLAAHNEGRVGLGMEISPSYVDIVLLRFQRQTGIVPIRVSTGEPVSFVEVGESPAVDERVAADA